MARLVPVLPLLLLPSVLPLPPPPPANGEWGPGPAGARARRRTVTRLRLLAPRARPWLSLAGLSHAPREGSPRREGGAAGGAHGAPATPHRPPPPAATGPRCPPDRFQCYPGAACFPGEWRCDGHPDCKDEGDERGCGTATPAEPSPEGAWVTSPRSSGGGRGGAAGWACGRRVANRTKAFHLRRFAPPRGRRARRASLRAEGALRGQPRPGLPREAALKHFPAEHAILAAPLREGSDAAASVLPSELLSSLGNGEAEGKTMGEALQGSRRWFLSS